METQSQGKRDSSKYRTLIMKNPAGIGDRIISTQYLMELARSTDRMFEIYWPINYRCGCKLDVLFDVSFKISYEDPYSQVKWIEKDQIPFGEILNLCKSQTGIVKLFGFYYTKPNNWYNIFNPTKEIKNIVKTFAENQFSEKMIGVHIRRQDKVSDTRTDTFVREVELQLLKEPTSKIFLATDDGGVLVLSEAQKKISHVFNSNQGVVDTFSKRFGDRLALYPRNRTDRSTQEGIINGVVELLLLRKTDFVIGTACSKYSELAVIDKPHILLRNNQREFL